MTDYNQGPSTRDLYFNQGLWGHSLPKKATWKCEIEQIECGFFKPEVHLSYVVHHKIQQLMTKIGHYEWLGYLAGTVKDYVFTISGISIPEQVVTSGQVEVLPEARLPKEMVGVIHSHHSMGSFFSGTDEEFVNANHQVSIVVSNKGYKAHIKAKMKCGEWAETECEVEVVYPNYDTARFIEEAVTHIHKRAYEVPTSLPGIPSYLMNTPLGDIFRVE